MTNYSLVKHAFVRVIGSEAIVLDLRQDRYFAFPNLPQLASEIDGWPRANIRLHVPYFSDQAAPLEELISRKLVTSNLQNGHRSMLIESVPPAADCVYEWRTSKARVSLKAVTAFRHAESETKRWWRRLPLEERVNRLVRKREQCARISPIDWDDVRRLVGAFFRLRIWSYSARDSCLFDSLVLSNFLCHYDVRASVVIGVAVAPFLAHSWAQIDDNSLNESCGRARTYQPIYVA
jgi:hypothetical protein